MCAHTLVDTPKQMHLNPSAEAMSTDFEGKPEVNPARHGTGPVVSTRYDDRPIAWAMKHLGLSKGDLMRRALDDLMETLGLRTTRATEDTP